MRARWMSRLTLALVPFAALACGDDTTDGTGGGGGSGGEGPTTTTAAGPTTTTAAGPTTTTGATTTVGSTGSTGGAGGEGGQGAGDQGGAGGEGGAPGTGGAGGDGQGGEGGSIIVEPDAGTDACPGDEPAIVLELDAPSRIFEATTANTTDDVDTCQSATPDSDGGDWMFQFTLPAAASLRITLTDGAGLDGNLVVRPDCAVADEYCFEHQVGGDVKEYALHTEPDTFSAIVDSVGAAAGSFQLRVRASTPACGDGILNPGESCDPGAGNPDDSCVDPGVAGECGFEPVSPVLDECPGEDIDVAEGVSVLLASDGYSTEGFADDYDGSCRLPGPSGAGGVDRVLALTPAVTGFLTVRIGADVDGNWICETAGFDDPRCFDAMMYARSTCDLTATERGCSNDFVNELTLDVVAGVPVFVFVDGYDALPSSSGAFDMELELIEIL